ncbi:VCBS domain-containing protein, partial [Shewanella fidelis]
QGQFGTLSIDNLGHWTYTADNSQAAIQGLKTGESVTDTLLVHSVDGTEQKISVTIKGTDDKAVISGTSTASLTEDKDVHSGQLRVDGALSVTDADNGQTQFNAESLQGQFGTLSIDNLGHWTYTADNSQAAIQGLKAGESLTDTLLIHSVDGTEQKITVTINGTDDKAVIAGTSTATLTEDKDVHSGQLRVDGALSVTDADNGQAQFTAESLQGQFGTLSIDNLGHWIYTADNSQAAIQGLKTGESVTDTLLVHSLDGTEQKISVTINGTDDKAVISGTSTASLTEDKDVHSGQLRVDGALSVTDADNGQAQFNAESLQGQFGTLSIDNLGHWIYTADNSQAAIQGLKTGESVTDTLLVHSLDGTEQKITVTINGTDDKAVITDAQSDTNLRGVTEDRGYIDTHYDLHYEGKLNIQDPDKGESSFDPNIGPQTYQGIGYDTKLGGHILLMRDGHYTYTLDNRNIQNLAAGETQKDSAVIRTADGTTHTIELTVHGTNDRPTIAAQSQSVVEGGTLLHGQMLGQDIDHGATLSYSAPNIDGLTLNSDGSYSFDPSHASYQSLAAGATKTLTIPVTVKDEHNASSTQDLTITITGVNNGASITGVSTGDVHEGHYYTAADGSISGGSVDDRSPDHMHGNIGKLWNDEIHTDGHLAIVDADTGESHAQTGTYYGTHGHVILQDNGDWSYYVSIGQDATGRAIDHLGQGESLTDTVTVKSADGTTHDIVITIHGSNDRPYCSSEVQLNSGKEDQAQTLSVAELLANTVDVDANDVGKLTISNLHVDHGSIQDNQDGTYTFTPEKDYNGQVHFSYDVKDAHGGITHTGATSTLTAVADSATFSGNDNDSIKEDRHVQGDADQSVAVSGVLNVTDPDANESEFVASRNVHAVNDPFGGNLSIGRAGDWTYSVPNANLNHLAEGETVQVTYQVRSRGGDTHNITIDVIGTNDAPTINVQTLVHGTEDVHYQMQASQFGFADVDSKDTLHSISITDLPDPAQGLFVLDGQAIHANQVIATSDISKLQFVPAHNFNGDVNFSYTVNDGRTDSAKVTNTLHIDAINDAASIDGKSHSSTSAAITEDSATSVISGQVSLIDPDLGEDKFAANTQITGLYGQLTLDENGSWHYALNNASPAVNGLNAGQQLTDTLTITSPDGSASQTIAITIHGHTDTPTLQLQEAGATQGLDLYAGIQGNQISQLQYSTDGVNFTSQIPAGFNLAADGHTLEVDPANSAYDHLANGAQHKIWVNYQLQEGSGSHAHLSSQQAQVVISGTSDKPVIHSFSANSDQYSGPVSGNLLQGATDVDDGSALILQDLQFKDPQTHHYITVHTGQDVSITGVGQIHIASNGDYQFTPDANFSGDVPEFIYRIVDTHGDYRDESQNTLNIHINANHQPSVQNLRGSTNEDTDFQFSLASFGYQDSDHDPLAHLSITQLPDPTAGSLMLNGQVVTQGQRISSSDIDALTFKPATNFNGDAHFSYTVNDGHQDSAPHSATLNVIAVNDLPTLTVHQTSHTQGSLVATDVDTGDTLTFSTPLTTGAFGSLSVDAQTGAYLYTPNHSVAHMSYNNATATYSGIDIFEVQVSDNHGGVTSQFISFNPQATISSTSTGSLVITSTIPNQPIITSQLPTGHIVATPPTNHVSIDLSASSDSGSSDNDNLTSDTTPDISGHTDIPFSKVTIYDGNNPVGHAISDANGNFTATLATLTDGSHSLSAKALAPSSVLPAVSPVLDINIDSSTATPTIDLATHSDSGTSNTDNLTNIHSPIFTGVAEANSSISVTDEHGNILASGSSNAAGQYQFTANQLSEGMHTLTVVATDSAGNQSREQLAIEVDYSAPTISKVNLKTETNHQPTFSGTVSLDTAKVDIVIKQGSHVLETLHATLDGKGGYSVDASNLPDGAYTAYIQATDNAGNQTPSGYAGEYDHFSVDTHANSPSITFESAGSDNVYNAAEVAAGAAHTITASIHLPSDASSSSTLVINGVVHTITNAEFLAGQVDIEVAPAATITASMVDSVGNHSNLASAVAPNADVTVAKLGVSLTHDSGQPGDLITNDGALSISGQEAGATLEYSIDNGAHWSQSFTPVAGVNTVTVRQTDNAGNVSAGTSISFTLDNQINAPTVALRSDTSGEFHPSADLITKDPRLSIQSEAGAKIEYSTDSGHSWSTVFNPSEGVNNLLVRQTDIAGNQSAATHFSFTLDTTPGTVSVNPISVDNALNAAENNQPLVITGTTSNIAAGDRIYIDFGNNHFREASIHSDGTWSLTVSAGDHQRYFSADGNYPIKIGSVDVAGNATPEISTHLIVDTQRPIPHISVDAVTADNVINLAESAQNIDITGTVSGDFNTGDIVSLSINGATISSLTAAVDASGHYSISVPAQTLIKANIHSIYASGQQPIHAIEASVITTDSVDNLGSATTGTQAFTIDTQASAVITIDPITADNVINAHESQTNIDITGSVTGDYQTGDTVTLTLNGNQYSGQVNQQGHYSISVAGSELVKDTDQQIDAAITVTDNAGNQHTANTATQIQVDTQTDLRVNSVSFTGGNHQQITVQMYLPLDSHLTTLTLTSSGGGTPVNVDVSQPSGQSPSASHPDHQYVTFHVDTALLADGDISVTATGQDNAGNIATATNTSSGLFHLNTNSAPSVSNANINLDEDSSHTFTLTDFGYSDSDNDALSHVTITRLSGDGVLTLNGKQVTVNQQISHSEIAAGHLSFTPVHNENGRQYANFQFSANDGHQDSATATMILNVDAINDAPTVGSSFISSKEDQPHSFTEAEFKFSDVDGDTLQHITIANVFHGHLSLHGTPVNIGDDVDARDLSSLVFTPSPNYHSTGLNSLAAVQFTANDGKTDSAQGSIFINVSAVNDPAHFSGTSIGDVTEDSHPQTSGRLTVSDPDGTQGFIAVQGGAGIIGSKGYGHAHIDANGNWTYNLYNHSDKVQHLAKGQTDSETITVQSADGTKHDIVITITGSNDLPTVAEKPQLGQTLGTHSVTEDANHSASGQLILNDIDGDILSVSVDPAHHAQFGHVQYDQHLGVWFYSVDNANSQVNALNDGDTLSDTFALLVDDGHGGKVSQTITVSINGHTDPAPYVAPTISVTVDTGHEHHLGTPRITAATMQQYAQQIGASSSQGHHHGQTSYQASNGHHEIKGHDSHDIITVSGSLHEEAELKDGNDILFIGGRLTDEEIEGGSGRDTLILGAYSNQNRPHLSHDKIGPMEIEGIENIILGDGTVLRGHLPANFPAIGQEHFEYQVNVAAHLATNDETITQITLSQLPSGVSLKSAGHELSANPDGSYTIPLSGVVTLVSTHSLKQHPATFETSVTTHNSVTGQTATTTEDTHGHVHTSIAPVTLTQSDAPQDDPQTMSVVLDDDNGANTINALEGATAHNTALDAINSAHSSPSIVESPVEHYLQMVGVNHNDVTSIPAATSTEALPQIAALTNNDPHTDMLDVEQSDGFENPLLDDDKHQVDLTSLDDPQDLSSQDIINDDDLLHQALNDMHNQV